MRNPSNFMESMKDAQNRESEFGQRQYEQKILTKLVPLFDYTVNDVRRAYMNTDVDNDPLGDIRYHNNDDLLDVIFIKKTKPQNLQNFIYKFGNTDAWKVFCTLYDTHNVTLLGMVFPMKGESDWIMHTLGMVGVPGVGRIVVPSRVAALRDIVVEPLKLFIEGKKEK